MAAASKASGLSRYLGLQLQALRVLPSFVMLIIICISTTFMTEVSSNTAIANILLPVLAEMVRICTVKKRKKILSLLFSFLLYIVCEYRIESIVFNVTCDIMLFLCFYAASSDPTECNRRCGIEHEDDRHGIILNNAF